MKKVLLTLVLAALPLFAMAEVPLGTPGQSPADSGGGSTGVTSVDGGSTGVNGSAGGSTGINSSPGGSTGIFPSPGGSVGVPASPGGSVGCGPGSNCYSVKNPINIWSLCGAIKKGFYALMPIMIAVGVVFIVWSGFQFVLAQGAPKKLTDAKKNFLNVLRGIAIVMAAWIIAEAIAATINALGGAAIITCN